MQTKEWTKVHHYPGLDLGLLHAHYVTHAYPRHSHDYYVISLIERGRQTFTHKGTKYATTPGGVILINPGEVHTGETVDEKGFELRSLYPTIDTMEMAAHELSGRRALPFFHTLRVDDSWTTNHVLSLHRSMMGGTDLLEIESRFLWTLVGLIQRYARPGSIEKETGSEKLAVRQARRYIEEYFAEGISLNELAQQVNLSPYYFLRAFRAEVGMPPHAYLESVRVRQAQRWIEAGRPLAEVAAEAGFSSQSHMTRRFKRILGVTPGQYAAQLTGPR
jgi:AraC-like DNA-binding protein